MYRLVTLRPLNCLLNNVYRKHNNNPTLFHSSVSMYSKLFQIIYTKTDKEFTIFHNKSNSNLLIVPLVFSAGIDRTFHGNVFNHEIVKSIDKYCVYLWEFQF